MKFTYAIALLLASSVEARNLKQIRLAQLKEQPADALENVPANEAADVAPVLEDGEGVMELNPEAASESYRRLGGMSKKLSLYDDDYDFDYKPKSKYDLDVKPCAACSLDNLKCPVVPTVSCPDLSTDLGNVVAESDAKNGDGALYGTDEQANLIAEQSAAQACQGVSKLAVPDTLTKINQVENGDGKTCAKEKEEWSGCRTKEFKIYGSIKIDETVSGGTCKENKGCEATTAKKETQSLKRVGDAAAYVEDSCACSGDIDTGCKCDACTEKTYE